MTDDKRQDQEPAEEDLTPQQREQEDQSFELKYLSPLQKQVIDKLFWRLIVFIFILFLFSFLDRINIGFAGLTMVNDPDIGLTMTEFGLAASLFYIAYVSFGVPSNMVLARVGARRWIAIIMVLWGIASTCTMFAWNATSLYVLRIFVGITEAGFLPGILLYLTYWFPSHFRARANALFMLAMPVTMAFGSIVSGYILQLDGVLELKGWQWLFFLEGFPCVILGVMVWFMLYDSPEKAKWLSDEEKQCLKEMMERDHLRLVQKEGPKATKALEPHTPEETKSMLALVFTKTVIMYTLAYFFLCNALNVVNTWSPTIIKSFAGEASLAMIGFLAAIPQFCTIAMMVWWGRRSDRKHERKFHTWFPYLFAGIGWILATTDDMPVLQLIGVCMASAGVFTAMAIFWTTPDQSIDPKARAIGIAVINAVGNLGSATGPFLVGFLYDLTGNFKIGMYTLVVALVLGIFTVIAIPMKQSRPMATP